AASVLAQAAARLTAGTFGGRRLEPSAGGGVRLSSANHHGAKTMRMRILAATAILAAASTGPAISQEAGAAPDATVAGPDQAADRPIGAATFLDADGETIGSANLRDTPHGVLIRF